MKILLGYDGSRGSAAAVVSLDRMGLPAEAECAHDELTPVASD
jgi:hypothetical protein